ncbi:hypothetical protein PG994_009904 [Apiospora phragmitis]|uniref:2EXR domain-containing protein n=1 Tax=Apiospora phragmitis TaxID=2905665 RepID=A0ABR1TNI9_9PEZI
MAPSTFPQFTRLSPELQAMVWQEFARDEAASRIVVTHNEQRIYEDGERRRADLRIMPLKRLVSPLLTVCFQAREAALRHYRTRVEVFERPSPVPCVLPNSGRSWAANLEFLVCYRAKTLMDVEGEGAMLTEEDEPQLEPQPRGCVYLDLESDRFLIFEQWCWSSGVWQHYGFRALSDAIDDARDHSGRMGRADLDALLERRPPVLRNASIKLLDEVLQQIRHVVIDDHVSAGEGEEEGGNGSGSGGQINPPAAVDADDESSTAIQNTLPRAFSPEGSSLGLLGHRGEGPLLLRRPRGQGARAP